MERLSRGHERDPRAPCLPPHRLLRDASVVLDDHHARARRPLDPVTPGSRPSAWPRSAEQSTQQLRSTWRRSRRVACSAPEAAVTGPRLLAGSEPRSSTEDMVVWGSLTLADSLMREGLVDEYRLQVCPVVLGRGKRLFEDGLATQWLTRLETNTYDDMVAVRYASAS
jgi:riboflavin biosynthesis pyrimidine reductase